MKQERMMQTTTVRLENRGTHGFGISNKNLEEVISQSGLREALEDVSVLVTFHDYNPDLSSPRSGCVTLLEPFRDECRIRVKVFVRDGDLEQANVTLAHELRHAAHYALWGVWAAAMDEGAAEEDAREFAYAHAREVVRGKGSTAMGERA